MPLGVGIRDETAGTPGFRFSYGCWVPLAEGTSRLAVTNPKSIGRMKLACLREAPGGAVSDRSSGRRSIFYVEPSQQNVVTMLEERGDKIFLVLFVAGSHKLVKASSCAGNPGRRAGPTQKRPCSRGLACAGGVNRCRAHVLARRQQIYTSNLTVSAS